MFIVVLFLFDNDLHDLTADNSEIENYLKGVFTRVWGSIEYILIGMFVLWAYVFGHLLRIYVLKKQRNPVERVRAVLR